jgi:exodeoxyribonuclease VII small subunit|nr:Exonuclease small subunit [Candidatus Cloacimonadota bacterium]
MKDKNMEELSFDEALTALEETVEQLSNTSTKLEELVELYEKGTHYLTICRNKLKEVEAKIQILSEQDPEKQAGDE